MSVGAHRRVDGLVRVWSKRERRIQFLALVIGLGIVVTVWALRDYISDARLVGYPGAFALSFLGSAAMVLPVPGLAAVCAFSLTLSPFLLGLLGGVGETIGELSGYAVGYGGGSVIEKRGFYTKLKGWMERRGVLILFLVSLIPNPAFDLVGITAGGVRFPIRRFLLTVWAGKTLKGLLVGYTCYYGYSMLPWVD